MEAKLDPYMLGKDEGRALWFLGCLTLVKATGPQTAGRFGLIDQVFPSGFASPYHVHHAEDEGFYILEGEMTFICGGEKLKAGPGAYVFGPRDIPHGFRVDGPGHARILLLATPAGFEQFVMDLSEPAMDRTTPSSALPDMERLVAVAAKYQIEILGPLPD